MAVCICHQVECICVIVQYLYIHMFIHFARNCPRKIYWEYLQHSNKHIALATPALRTGCPTSFWVIMHFDVNVVFTKRFSIYLSNLLCKLNFSSLRLLISNVVTKTDNKTRFQINTINILLVLFKTSNTCERFKSKLLRD